MIFSGQLLRQHKSTRNVYGDVHMVNDVNRIHDPLVINVQEEDDSIA
jgi:hypothetical protein